MTVSQANFVAAVLNPDLPRPTGLSDPQGRPAGKRFDVYRNNVIVSLTDAMQDAFPVIHKLVGDEFFNAMAGVHVRAHPPKHPILMLYGDDFPEFLAGFEPAQSLPYLPDIARLEHLRRESYHAADATAIAPDDLTKIDPEHLMQARLILDPSVRLITSDYPIHGIWCLNMIEDAPKPTPQGECVLVVRPELDTELHLIDPATYAFLNALKTQTLQAAYEVATTLDDGFDLSNALSLMLRTKTITNIML